MNYFVTAIHTDSGKTLISAMLCDALYADYWKPVQCGTPTDIDTVKNLVSNTKTHFHPEAYFLKKPASPHDAAAEQGLDIKLDNIQVPTSYNSNMVIEGAGGIMVPLNQKDCIIDMISPFNSEVILVSNNYLGSINHTLLTIEVLKQRNIPIKGIIFNKAGNSPTEDIILQKSGLKCLLKLPKLSDLKAESLKPYIEKLRKVLS